jgi:mevalonate kinase
MLLGEYAVLEGHPALAMCLDRRICCEAELIPGSRRLRVESEMVFSDPIELSMDSLSSETSPLPELRLLWPVLRARAPRQGGLSLRFDASFPPTWGLGSSSASTLAAAGALRALQGEATEGVAVFNEVRSAQRALQGAASGYDVATQLLGGYVVFADADVPMMEQVVPPPSAQLNWVVAWTGRKADTGDMIRNVLSRFEVGHSLYADIGALAQRGIRNLRAGDVEALGHDLSEGQMLLDGLGAVPTELAGLVKRLQQNPAVLGARLSGAGGGDCILVLASDADEAARACAEQGLEVLSLALAREGLLEEELR